MFLHSGFGNENTNLDENSGLLVKLASEHGYILVSPLGYQGAYGNFLALPAVYGQQAAANDLIAAITTASERTNELSEKDVINVLEIVLNEYPIDRGAMFLTGHSMGAGGTWYIGAKYSGYWTALATLSGPFVQETGYLWDNIRPLPNLITEGTDTAGTTGSRLLYDTMKKNGYQVEYKEVTADHGGMIPLVLPDVFKFFDSHRAK
jgi:predicted peptidase